MKSQSVRILQVWKSKAWVNPFADFGIPSDQVEDFGGELLEMSDSLRQYVIVMFPERHQPHLSWLARQMKTVLHVRGFVKECDERDQLSALTVEITSLSGLLTRRSAFQCNVRSCFSSAHVVCCSDAASCPAKTGCGSLWRLGPVESSKGRENYGNCMGAGA